MPRFIAPRLAAALCLFAVASVLGPEAVAAPGGAEACLVRTPSSAELARGERMPSRVVSGADPHRIVLRFLVLRRSDGTGGVTDTALFHDMMRDLNHGFRGLPFVFVNLPAIEFVDDDRYYTINTLAEAVDLMTAYEEPGVVNIFFSDQRVFDTFQARTYTSPASPRGHIYGDVVGLPYHTPFAPHEMGHLFWLWHPYETQFGPECVNGTNCSSAGDRVCDTPASPAVFNGNTTATGLYYGNQLGPCTGDPVYRPRTDLYMEAGWAPGHAGYMYRHAFSDGQVSRMLQILDAFSSDLIGPQRPDVLVDCDGDLADDIVEITSGAEIDLNQDMVPDRCQTFARDGDLLVSGMHAGLTNRPRFFDKTTGTYRGDLWSGAWWIHQFRSGPEGYVYMPSLTVVQRMSLESGRLVDNFVDGVLEGAGTFVDILWDKAGDLLLLDNVTRRISRYGGVTGLFMGEFANLNPSGMTSPKYMEYGPDANIYVVGNGANGNTIQMVHGATGVLLGSFITPGAGGLTAGQGLAFHEGFLYVSNGGANDVVRFDATTGAFAGVFVSPGSGGLSNPHSLRFGPDGNLYVASRSTNSVKRYDGLDGAYLGDFVAPGAGGPPGSGGVTQPAGILFVERDVVSSPEVAPDGKLSLSPGTPNPFTGSTVLHFELPAATFVTLRIFDARGSLVRSIAEERRPAGGSWAHWDGTSDAGRPVPAGVYFADLRTDETRRAVRLVLAR